MDRNNNTSSGNDQNGIVLVGTGSHKAAQLAVSSTAAELKGHADHKRNDLTEALLPRRSTAEELTDADADVGGCIVFPARIKRLSIHYLGFTSLVFRDA
ncbi:hypothetical protein TYRP_011294 [Tyrophagus putrescentiae]|nr:hypothetical protein TYRP_011294 [Tyrophagus putrescentiae]